jgi:hypothetical protein
MILARSSKEEPIILPAPACATQNRAMAAQKKTHTMFSMTVMTDFVALCDWLRHAAISDIEASGVPAPTVEPGLESNVIDFKLEYHRKCVLKVIK